MLKDENPCSFPISFGSPSTLGFWALTSGPSHAGAESRASEAEKALRGCGTGNCKQGFFSTSRREARRYGWVPAAWHLWLRSCVRSFHFLKTHRATFLPTTYSQSGGSGTVASSPTQCGTCCYRRRSGVLSVVLRTTFAFCSEKGTGWLYNKS